MYDIVVVGGGPAGCRTAAVLAKDHDVLVLEEHAESGTPVQCAGLVTERTISLSGVRPDILNRFHGADVIFPGGEVASVRSSDVKAVMIDRGDFDRKMAASAADAGAEIRYSAKYEGHRVHDGIVTVTASGEDIDARMIVGADGHSSKVASSIPNNAPREYLRGLQYDMKGGDGSDNITIRIGTDIAPGLFSWEAPFGEFIRVGLCNSWDSGLPSDFMKVLLKRSGLEGNEIVARYSGKVPVGRRRRTYADNLLLIGDAASQVKPVSAGGLFPALSCVPYLCETANGALSSGDLSERSLSGYEKAWGADIGKELDSAYTLRKFYVKCTNRDMDLMYRSVSNERASKILDTVDIDRPSRIARSALRNPVTAFRLASILLKAKVRR